MIIIELACLSFLFVNAEPLILFKRFCGYREEQMHTYSKTKQFIHKLIYCCLCSGFWIGLIFSGSILKAALISVIAEIISKINNRL